jgi:nitroimidazol reductase NimA-like FMN-containing flavoprotein (pyridoxamine 5'-phosphate oxidase superfamily)
MRRKEKEITDKKDIESSIKDYKLCRQGLSDGNRPYVVPLCFGYENDMLYFHTAHKGMKLDILKKNNQVCFEFDIDANHIVLEDDDACEWGLQYMSVIGFGKAEFVEDPEPKRKALDIIMKQYSNKSWDYKDAMIKRTTIVEVKIESITGKISGS